MEKLTRIERNVIEKLLVNELADDEKIAKDCTLRRIILKIKCNDML